MARQEAPIMPMLPSHQGWEAVHPMELHTSSTS
jgi:hypothetical protein